MDAASLRIDIDGSSIAPVTRDLDSLAQYARIAESVTSRLEAEWKRSRQTTLEYNESFRTLSGSITSTSSAIEQMVLRVQTMSREFTEGRASITGFMESMRQLDSVARTFQTTTTGMENFVRQAREVGLSSNEMQNALSRIQSAIQGVTEQGRETRNVLLNYGIDVSGMSQNSAADVLRQYRAARGRFAADSGRSFDDYSVLGGLGIDSTISFGTNTFRTQDQRDRAEEMRRGSDAMAAARERMFNEQREEQRLQERVRALQGEYGGWLPYQLGLRGNLAQEDRRLRALAGLDENGQPIYGPTQGAGISRSEIFNSSIMGSIAGLYRYTQGPQFSADRMDIDARFRADSNRGDGSGQAWANWINRRVLQGWGMYDSSTATGEPDWDQYNPWQRLGIQVEQSFAANIWDATRSAWMGPSAYLPGNRIAGRQTTTTPALPTAQQNERLGAFNAELTRARNELMLDPSVAGVRRNELAILRGMGINITPELQNFGVPPSEMDEATRERFRISEGQVRALRDRAELDRDTLIYGGSRDTENQLGLYRALTRGIETSGTIGGGQVEAQVFQRRLQLEAMGIRRGENQESILTAFRNNLFRTQEGMKDAADAQIGVQTGTFDSMARFFSAGGNNAESQALLSRLTGEMNLNPNGPRVGARLDAMVGQYNLGLAQSAFMADREMAGSNRLAGVAPGDLSQYSEINRNLQLEREHREAIIAIRARAIQLGENENRAADQYLEKVRQTQAVLESAVRTRGIASTLQDASSMEGLTIDYSGMSSAGRNREQALDQQASQLYARRLDSEGLTGAARLARARELRLADEQGNAALQRQYDASQNQRNALSEDMFQARLSAAGTATTGVGVIDRFTRFQQQLSMAQFAGNPEEIQRAIAMAQAGYGAETQGLANMFRMQNFNQIYGFQAQAALYGVGSMPTGGVVNLDRGQYSPMIRRMAAEMNVPAHVALAIAQTESGGNMSAVNRNTNGTFDSGLFQINSETAARRGWDVSTPEGNIRAGLTHLREDLQAVGGDPELAWIRFNRGATNYDRWVERGARWEDLPGPTRSGVLRLRQNLGGVPDWSGREPEFRTGTAMTGPLAGYGGVNMMDLAASDPQAYRAYRFGGERALRITQEARQAAEQGGVSQTEAERERGAVATAQTFANLGQAVLRASESIDIMGERSRAIAQGGFAELENSIRESNRELRAQLELASRSGNQSERARAQAGLQTLSEAERRQAISISESRWARESAALEDRMVGARVDRENWWMPGSLAARERTMATERRRLSRDYSYMSNDERESRVRELGEAAELEEFNRLTGLVRDSWFQFGQVASTALDQIIVKGGDARQVISALLSDLASYIARRAMMNLWEVGSNYAAKGIQAILGAASGAAAADVSGGFATTDYTSGLPTGSSSFGGGVYRYADGGVLWNNHLIPMASGRVIDRMAIFPMANGTGIAGEAGPEAVVPLTRMPSGQLGVKSSGGGGMSIYMPITVNGGSSGNSAQDAEFAKKIGSEVQRQVSSIVSSEIRNQMRPGGMLLGGGSPGFGM